MPGATAPYKLPDGQTVEAPIPPAGYRLHHVLNGTITPPLGMVSSVLTWMPAQQRWGDLYYMNTTDQWYATRP